MEQNTSAFKELFEVSDSDGLAALPETFSDTATELVEAYEVQLRPVVAMALATAAAACGSYARVVVPQSGRWVTLGFNVVVAIDSGRTPGWIDFLRAPLLGPIFDMQLSLGDLGPEVAKKRITHGAETLNATRKANPDPGMLKVLEQDLARQRAGLQPALLSNRLSPVHVEQVINGCFDGSVLLTDPSSDPVESFLALKTGEKLDLIKLLNCSWEGLPLSFEQRVKSGSLSMFWVTQEELLLPLCDTVLVNGALPPPILWLKSPVNGLRGTKHGIPSEKIWKKAIEILFNFRCHQQTEEFKSSDEAEVVFSQFERDIEAFIKVNRNSLARHLTWLPALARRVAVICTVFSEGAPSTISSDAASAAVLVVRWLAADHLRVLLTLEAAPVSPGTDRSTLTDNHDPSEVMLRKIRQKAPVSRRTLWRSYDNPNAVTFQSALDGLIRAGHVVKDSSEMLVPVESSGSATVVAVE